MTAVLFLLAIAISSLRGGNSEILKQKCGVSDIITNSVNLSVMSKRNETGKWTTTFIAYGEAGDLPDGLTLNVKQTIQRCNEKEFVQIQGSFGEGIAQPISSDSVPQEKGERLIFYERTGPNIVLSNNGRTATRKNAENVIGGGTAITNRPLKDKELFELKLEKNIDKYGRSISIGVTTHTPPEIKFSDHMNYFSSGVCIYYLHNIFCNGVDLRKGYGVNLGNLKEGDRVGMVKNPNGSLNFFVNGVDQGVVDVNMTGTVYGVMDLYGNPVQASIVSPS